MSREEGFLAGYDPARFDRPAVTVDLVLMTVTAGALHSLLLRRDAHPAKGRWALPGSFVQPEESLDEAARRVLHDKARIGPTYLEQLYTFGEVKRDPRMRVITVAYFALLPETRFSAALRANDLTLARLQTPWSGVSGGPAGVRSPDGETLALAFDHGDILALAVNRLRGKLDYSNIAFALLPQRFTLRALQDVHEAILGQSLNKPAFRRRLLDTGALQATGTREQGVTFRPAELYRHARRNQKSQRGS